MYIYSYSPDKVGFANLVLLSILSVQGVILGKEINRIAQKNMTKWTTNGRKLKKMLICRYMYLCIFKLYLIFIMYLIYLYTFKSME